MPMIYRPVLRFPGYRVSDTGEVWSEWAKSSLGRGRGSYSFRSGVWTKLRASPHKSGYPRVILHRDGRAHHKYVHCLVAEAFLGDCPVGLEVRHRNGVKTDCSLSNLTYGTPLENSADKEVHGTILRGVEHPAATLSEMDVSVIKGLVLSGKSQRSIAKLFGVSQGHISNICRGTRRRVK
jgi:hypothetical protein